MIRVAAAGDLHVGADSKGTLRPYLSDVAERADVLLLAGDLTKTGQADEAEVLRGELDGIGVPVVAVLGNHDHHSDQVNDVRAQLQRAGVVVLEEEGCVIELPSGTLGVAGAKGFGGGFVGASVTEFGEPEIKRFVRVTKATASVLRERLAELTSDVRVALLHYSPVRDTLQGEPLEIYPFLGATSSPRRWTPPAQTSSCTGTRIAGRNGGRRPGGSPFATSPSP